VLQVAGCSNKCDGCFNKTSWNKNSGSLFTEETYQELYNAASKSFISNIVFQGGDCMFSSNVQPSISLFRRLRKDLPDTKLVMFTGLTYEQIQNDLLRQPCLYELDYIVDGLYMKDLPTDKSDRGSSNQILHTLKNGISIKQE
jgi:anaerobic ribonucleoside-triphosphate reductase activating protein